MAKRKSLPAACRGLETMIKAEHRRPGVRSLRASMMLPMPPSTNALWFNAPGRGRVRTVGYRAWIAEAGWELKRQKPQRITGAVGMRIRAGVCARSRDLDNIFKALLDLLVTHQIIPDDSAVTSIAATWDRTVPAGRVMIHAWRSKPPMQRLTKEARERVAAAQRARWTGIRAGGGKPSAVTAAAADLGGRATVRA